MKYFLKVQLKMLIVYQTTYMINKKISLVHIQIAPGDRQSEPWPRSPNKIETYREIQEHIEHKLNEENMRTECKIGEALEKIGQQTLNNWPKRQKTEIKGIKSLITYSAISMKIFFSSMNIFKTKVFTNIIRRDQNEKNKCSYF